MVTGLQSDKISRFSEGVFRLTQNEHVFKVFRKTVIVQAFVDSN